MCGIEEKKEEAIHFESPPTGDPKALLLH
jgi:hypothetical protein